MMNNCYWILSHGGHTDYYTESHKGKDKVLHLLYCFLHEINSWPKALHNLGSGS